MSTWLGQIVFTVNVLQFGLVMSATCTYYSSTRGSILRIFTTIFSSALLEIIDGSTVEYSLGVDAQNNVLKPFDHQVAGHKYSYSEEDTQIGMMKQSAEEYLLKPVTHPVYGPREIHFYELVRTTHDLELEELKEYVPKYDGTSTVVFHNKNVTFIRMEDVTTHFKLPCVIDLKIGQKTWEPDAPIRKVLEQTVISPVMKAIWGFSINGLKYYDIERRVPVVRDKAYYSRRVFFHEVVKEVYSFLNGEFGIARGLVNDILKQLGKIHSWFLRQKRFFFIGSSILLAYDAEHFRNRTQEYVGRKKTGIQIRMIDFAHTIPNTTKNEVDLNYLRSLENLMYIFEHLTALHAGTFSNRMVTSIMRRFSWDEIFRYFKSVFGLRK